MRHKCNTSRCARQEFKRAHHCGTVAGVALLSMLAFTALAQSAQQPRFVPGQENANNPVLSSVHEPGSDAHATLKSPGMSSQTPLENAAEIQRHHISDQSAILLQLATELKRAVDNSDQRTLSIHIVRKADSIAKLAHGVKEEMKHTVAQR